MIWAICLHLFSEVRSLKTLFHFQVSDVQRNSVLCNTFAVILDFMNSYFYSESYIVHFEQWYIYTCNEGRLAWNTQMFTDCFRPHPHYTICKWKWYCFVSDTATVHTTMPKMISENGSSRKRSPEWNDLKTVQFENAVFLVCMAKTMLYIWKWWHHHNTTTMSIQD